MTRAIVSLGLLASSLYACTSTPPPAPPAPVAAADPNGVDPCLEELLKQTEANDAAVPAAAPMNEDDAKAP